ncbi:peptidoglycan-binding domain-containing protein [Dermacoccaceae bacterium W4C1]
MRTGRIAATTVALTALASFGAAAVPGTAEAAGATCTSGSYTSGSDTVYRPNHGGSRSCYLNGSVNVSKTGTAALQKALNRCYGKHLDVDGIYGKNTKAALASVQKGTRDGLYGPATASYLKVPVQYHHGDGKIHCQVG